MYETGGELTVWAKLLLGLVVLPIIFVTVILGDPPMRKVEKYMFLYYIYAAIFLWFLFKNKISNWSSK